MIPAIATGPSRSQISRSSSVSSRSTPSRVTRRSPLLGPADDDPGTGEPLQDRRRAAAGRAPTSRSWSRRRSVRPAASPRPSASPAPAAGWIPSTHPGAPGRGRGDSRPARAAPPSRASSARSGSFVDGRLRVGERHARGSTRSRAPRRRPRGSRAGSARPRYPARPHRDRAPTSRPPRPGTSSGGRTRMAVSCSSEIPSSRGEQSIPLDDSPGALRAERLGQDRHPGAGLSPRNEVARRHVADADHDLHWSVPGFDGREAELVGVRMVADLQHLRHDHALESGPGPLDGLDLGSPRADALGELLDVQLERRELARATKRGPSRPHLRTARGSGCRPRPAAGCLGSR